MKIGEISGQRNAKKSENRPRVENEEKGVERGPRRSLIESETLRIELCE